jgi:hypothetical protein
MIALVIDRLFWLLPILPMDGCWEHLGINPRTVVSNGHFYFAMFSLSQHSNLAFRIGIFCSIREQIGKDLYQPSSISENPYVLGRQVDIKHMMPAFQSRSTFYSVAAN